MISSGLYRFFDISRLLEIGRTLTPPRTDFVGEGQLMTGEPEAMRWLEARSHPYLRKPFRGHELWAAVGLALRTGARFDLIASRRSRWR
jgi:hypothetical protein